MLSAVAGVGTMVPVYGLVVLALWPTLLGMAIVYLGKLWFLDRMVWLYQDMKNVNPQYRAWLRDAATVTRPATDK